MRSQKNTSTILLIEDEPEDVKILQGYLKNKDFHIIQYASVGEVCENNINEPDLILSDLNVLDSVGVQTFDFLKERFPKVPIIVLTGASENLMIEPFLQKGAYNFISKDHMSRTSLQSIVKFALKRANIEKNLIDTIQEANQNSESKSRFFAHLSHEIKTPLNAVIGMASLLKECKLDDYQTDLLNGLILGSERLNTIINDILDMSKIESGKMAVEDTQFEIRKLIHNCLKIFTADTQKSNMFVSNYCDPQVPRWMIAGSNQIKQILINFISNAFKYAPNGHLHIHVTSSNETVKIEISDSGPGLSQKQLNHIFEPFVQARTKDQLKGTGLGLSICKKLAGLLGGDVGVNSELGKGSTFWFTFEYSKVETEETKRIDLEGLNSLIMSNDRNLSHILSKQLASREVHCKYMSFDRFDTASLSLYDVIIFDQRDSDHHNKLKVVRSHHQHVIVVISDTMDVHSKDSFTLKNPFCHFKTLDVLAHCLGDKSAKEKSKDENKLENIKFPHLNILIVDDDELNRKVLSRILESRKLSFETAANGLEAINHVKEKSYDIIFMDCMMPVMDGYRATEIIKTMTPKAVVVALTAVSLNEDKQRCVEAGMDFFLAKPIKKEQIDILLVKICNFLYPPNHHKDKNLPSPQASLSSKDMTDWS